MSIFAKDGSVSVSHGGIEMGQGINTKVRQVVADKLGIDMALIKIKPVANLTNPNAFTTGGSMGSELNCAAAIKVRESLFFSYACIPITKLSNDSFTASFF